MRRKSWQRRVQTPSSGGARPRGGLGTAAHPPRPGGAGVRCGAAPGGPPGPLVVAADPGLNGAARASQGPGDRGAGVALLGQDDGLMTQPDLFLREGFGQSSKFFEAVMALDKHRSSSWCDSDAQSILPNRHNPWNRSARIFRNWYSLQSATWNQIGFGTPSRMRGGGTGPGGAYPRTSEKLCVCR